MTLHKQIILLFVFIPLTLSAEYNSQECKGKNIRANELIGDFLPKSDYDQACIEALYIAFKYVEHVGGGRIKNPLKGYSYLNCKSYGNERARVILMPKEIPCSDEEVQWTQEHNPKRMLSINIESQTVEIDYGTGKNINWVLE